MKKTLPSIFAMLITFYSFSQGEKVIHPTPEAATLIKMAQNEVNLNTGTASIGIPLYTLSEGGITVPIGLNYAGAGGIKVEEAATWVGLGWNLNAGGQITRVVRDKPDESYTMNFKKNEKNLYLDKVTLGFNLKAASIDVTWQNETLRYRGGWFLTGSVMDSESRLYDDFKKSDPMLFDTAPDIYIADLGGEIVKFTFDEESKPVILNNKDVKIEVVWEDYDPSEYFTKQEWSISATISGDEMWGNKMNSIFGSGVALGLTLGLDQFFRIPRDNPAIIGFRKWIITTADGVEWHFGEEDKNKNASLSNKPYTIKKQKYEGAIESRANTNFVFIKHNGWDLDSLKQNNKRCVDLLMQYYAGNNLKTFQQIKKNQY